MFVDQRSSLPPSKKLLMPMLLGIGTSAWEIVPVQLMQTQISEEEVVDTVYLTTSGGCRCRQAIPPVLGGRLDIDANYGIQKAVLPQTFSSPAPARSTYQVDALPLDPS
ncbi:Pyrimidine-specific ribonucleoside hydrolase RihA isoform C [Senna tora]|uniref:Pyrimidine-specific ribonucleoside hydrolase RihA isoform C n=1 Tax=Senna tora TaxID=362788 RepID=A0A834U068_9FABA|nr:Pyrimidine-specific ribonucleoside hydrolase RihA isoform C [Senna tora]